jgi:hypothetical protein
MRYTDPQGLDVIVLLDRKAAFEQGHIGVLIGSDKAGWEYLSFAPKHDLPRDKSTLTDMKFDTLADAKKSESLDRYSEYKRWTTGAEKDAKGIKAALGYEGKDWVLTGSNCVNMVVSATDAAGLNVQILLATRTGREAIRGLIGLPPRKMLTHRGIIVFPSPIRTFEDAKADEWGLWQTKEEGLQGG